MFGRVEAKDDETAKDEVEGRGKVATSFEVSLPGWAGDALAAAPPHPSDLADLEARMRWVIALARKNFVEDTGGPFAAAVSRRRPDGWCRSA